ncbi:MAG: oxidoreductase, Gfo/Idh/MocA family [Acidobacteria bacterium]|jgi:predicted dehydrogenase|nr:oxidoreductase, Gfo/Idh/MocA family [Acidobacteriota bacterium]
MVKKIRWGVLGAANIAIKKVIPAMRQGRYSEIIAIASRDAEKAKRAADELNIPKSYGSYEELLADEEIDAVYNPLPNNLHVEWTIKAAEAGKHVLCEKPIGLSSAEAAKLIDTRDRTGVKIQEAFMVRTHPQWLVVRDLIERERIGALQSITGFFSYFNTDAANIRNSLETGGGALMDIGCYCINLSRFILGEEPRRVSALIERDARTKIDKLTSAILDFPTCQSTFTCATQLVPFQRMQFFGTKGRIEVEIPFNIPPDQPTRIFIDAGADLFGANVETIKVPAADQYTIQGDLFSRAILEGSEQAIPLEDSVKNMSVIEAVFRAAETGNWESPD